MNDFNFLIEPTIVDKIKPEPYVGPNLDTMAAMTPKQFASTILEVYRRLGGASWLFAEAQANPRAFLELLKKMIPSGIQMKDLAGFSIRLIDQFGNQVEFETGVHPAIEPPPATSGNGLGQPAKAEHTSRCDTDHAEGVHRIATGGNPQDSEAGSQDSEVEIIDHFPERKKS